MRHPTDGVLRRLVDEPAGVADPDREHVAGCTQCLAQLAAVRADAEATAAALDVAPDVDVDAAWRRLSAGVATPVRRPAPVVERRRRWRTALTSPVVAALGAVTLVTGAGAAAAADWLQIFRTEEVAPLAITQADLMALPDLTDYGDIEVTSEPDVREVADVDAAEEATGLEVPEVRDLPRGVVGEPTLQVGDQVSAVFTFSVAQAESLVRDSGEELPPPPPGLDGSRFRLTAGPGVAAVWSESRGIPALVVARAVAPTAYSSDVPFDTARDYLLSLPVLPDALADQLRRFSADGTTLPLPVPADEVDASSVDVDGVPATVLSTRDGAMAAVVWVEDGVVTAVAGSLSTDEVLDVARDLEQ